MHSRQLVSLLVQGKQLFPARYVVVEHVVPTIAGKLGVPEPPGLDPPGIVPDPPGVVPEPPGDVGGVTQFDPLQTVGLGQTTLLGLETQSPLKRVKAALHLVHILPSIVHSRHPAILLPQGKQMSILR